MTQGAPGTCGGRWAGTDCLGVRCVGDTSRPWKERTVPFPGSAFVRAALPGVQVVAHG